MTTAKFDPYRFVQDKKEIRPLNEHGKEDGNFNYVHETHVWSLIERISKNQCPNLIDGICEITGRNPETDEPE